MPENNRNNTEQHLSFLTSAFQSDGFDVTVHQEFQGKIGILAESKTAINSVTGRPKRVYYLEGSNYQMGYLLGLLAEDQVARMTTEFVDNILPQFIAEIYAELVKFPLIKRIYKILLELFINESQKHKKDVPHEFIEELCGLYSGCLRANPSSKVEWERLWALNFGFDYLLSQVYTGAIFQKHRIKSRYLKIPLMCNSFSLFGEIVEGDQHYFGRDYMFPTANVYQDLACLIIYQPGDYQNQKRWPMVSQTAPGIIGSIAAMNSQGMAIGLDMCPSMLCNPDRPGFNSLGLLRDCMHYCRSADELVERVTRTQRGVSWLYPVAQGNEMDKACVIEAGAKLEFPPKPKLPGRYKKHLPDIAAPADGLVVRWNGYLYPEEYLKYNQKLWTTFNKDWRWRWGELQGAFFVNLLKFLTGNWKGMNFCRQVKQACRKVKYNPHDFGEKGFINKNHLDHNIPGPFYFAPQRENRSDVVLVSNHNLAPAMRLFSMTDWNESLAGEDLINIQWRYDELNYIILQEIEKGKITEETAWKLINFLSPAPGSYYPIYYNPGLKKDWRIIPIGGSVNLFELKNRKVISLFGYYGDEPIRVNLMKYVG